MRPQSLPLPLSLLCLVLLLGVLALGLLPCSAEPGSRCQTRRYQWKPSPGVVDSTRSQLENPDKARSRPPRTLSDRPREPLGHAKARRGKGKNKRRNNRHRKNNRPHQNHRPSPAKASPLEDWPPVGPLEDMHNFSLPLASGAEPNCTRCFMYEMAKERRIQHVKEQILEQLGLDSEPNITINRTDLPNNPEFRSLLDSYAMQQDAPMSGINQYHQPMDETASVETTGIYTTPEEPPANLNLTGLVYFSSFHSKLTNMKLLDAMLHLYLHPIPRPRKTKSLMVTLYRINPRAEIDPTAPYPKTKIAHKKLGLLKKCQIQKAMKGQWLKVNLTRTVNEWLADPDSNLGLQVEAYDEQRNPLVITSHTEQQRPHLQLHVEDKVRSRTRRYNEESRICKDDAAEVMCCMFDLTVDFEELKWDWIIVPKMFNVRFCSGLCPYVLLQKYPHTHLLQQSKSRPTDGHDAVGPCCTPKSMGPMQLIWVDPSAVTRSGFLQGMQVLSCGCS